MPPDTVSRYLRELNRGIPVHVPRPIDTAKLFATVSDVLPRIDYRRLLGPSVVAAMRPADATSLVAGFSSAVRPLEAAPILERIVEDAVDAVETDLGGEPASFDELSEPELVDAVIVISAVVEAILNVVAYHANDGRIQLAALYLGVVVAMLAAAALAVKVCQSKP
jgi:hypothetical protein